MIKRIFVCFSVWQVWKTLNEDTRYPTRRPIFKTLSIEWREVKIINFTVWESNPQTLRLQSASEFSAFPALKS